MPTAPISLSSVTVIELTDIRRIPSHFGAIVGPIEACCKELQSVAGCAGGQIVGLAAAKGWGASYGLHQGTPRPSPLLHLLPLPLMPARAVHASGRSATGFRRTTGEAPRPRRAGR